MQRPSEAGPSAAIVGLGITETGQVYGPSAADFAVDAVRLAVADAGLDLDAVDGLLVSSGLSGGVDIGLARQLGLRDLGLLSQISQAGSTANAQVQMAALAIAGGLATTVVCVHADAPLKPAVRSGDAYRRPAGAVGMGFRGLAAISGPRNPNGSYALAARRHMNRFGTTSEQLATITVGQRQWAAGNPRARFREPITVADHQASRLVVDPLRLLDCCMVSNGGVAVVVTSNERAASLAQPPVHLWGWAQTHPGYRLERGSDWGLRTGAAIAGPAAMAMAGITPGDVDVCAIYDCYTYTTLVTLEDYGFCAKGEGGPFADTGALAPGGALPTNTGGGQLSSFYLWGMTPLSEGVIQVRGQGGERQVPRHEVAVVSGNGGVLDHHSTLVLGSQPAMTNEDATTEFRIERNEASAPFFDAARRGQLLIRRCGACGRLYPPHQKRCYDSDVLEWQVAAGTATLVTWAVDYAAAVSGEFLSPTGEGSVIGIVELAEGPWVNTALPGIDPAQLREGMPMEVQFLEIGGGEPVPVFLPAAPETMGNGE